MRLFKINRYLLAIIFVIFLFIYALNEKSYLYSYVLIIPFCFIISCFLETNLYRKYTLVLKIIYVLSIFKYFIMPLMIVATDNIWSYGPKPTDQSFILATFICCFEIFTLLLVKYLFINKKIKFNKGTVYGKWFSKNIKFKFIFLVLAISFFVFFNKELLLPKDIFSEVNHDDDIIQNRNSLSIIAKWIKLIGFPIITLFAYRFFNRRLSYYVSIIAFMIFGYLQLGLSRWTLIFYSIVSFLFLYKIYGQRVKKIAIPVCVILVFLLLSISIYKFSWSVQDSDNKFIDIIIVMSEQFQMYFSGPTLIAQSIDITNNSVLNQKIGIETFINDFMGSVPILSSNFDQTNRINFIFNEYIFGINTTNQTQIIPISGIGNIYFGLFGSTIFVFLFSYIALKLESIANNSSDIINYWIITYMAIWCSCSIIFCTQIIWGNIVANYLIILIINNLINKIKN